MPQSAAAKVKTAARRVRCVELAAEGHSYDEIARIAGFSHRSAARKAVLRELETRSVEAVTTLRALECARLDALQASLWDRAMDGDSKAAATIVRVISMRAKLLGLFDDGPPPSGPRGRVVTGHYDSVPRPPKRSDTE